MEPEYGQKHAAVTVLDIGGMGGGVKQQALSVARTWRFWPLMFLPPS
jgi:hypothetical protein